MNTITGFNARNLVYVGLALVLVLRVVYVFLVPNAIPETWRDGALLRQHRSQLDLGRWLPGYRPENGRASHPDADPSAPTARWMPGYPLFVAGVYVVFGANPRAVYVMQALLGVAIAGFTYAIAKHTLGTQVAVLAVFLNALDPLSLSLAGIFQTEQLFTLLIVASIYFFVRMSGHTRFRILFALLFGLFAGVADLTRTCGGIDVRWTIPWRGVWLGKTFQDD